MDATSTTHGSPAGRFPVHHPWRDRNMRDPHRYSSVGVRDFAGHRDSHHDAVLLWLHGGSWTSGSVETWTPALARLAHDLPCRLVAVRYRLAPHPAGIADLTTAVLATRAERPGTSVLVGGDSAGATIAASTAIHLGRGLVDGQVLLYPPADPSCAAIPAAGTFPTRGHMRAAWSAYAGARHAPDIALSPLQARATASTPPATLVVGGVDPLAHEIESLTRHLLAAGVRVTRRVLPGVGHGALLHPHGPVVDAVVAAVVDATRELVVDGVDA